MFMDDFSVYGSYFNVWLNSLDKVFHRRVETNLILNYEKKCHLMVELDIILGVRLM